MGSVLALLIEWAWEEQAVGCHCNISIIHQVETKHFFILE